MGNLHPLKALQVGMERVYHQYRRHTGHADFSARSNGFSPWSSSVLNAGDANEGPCPRPAMCSCGPYAWIAPHRGSNKIVRPHAGHLRRSRKDLRPLSCIGGNRTNRPISHPLVYGSALEGWIVHDPESDPHEGMDALLKTFVKGYRNPRLKSTRPSVCRYRRWLERLSRFIGCGPGVGGHSPKGEDLVRHRRADRSESHSRRLAGNRHRKPRECSLVGDARPGAPGG